MTTQQQINDKIFELIDLYIEAKIPMSRMSVDYDVGGPVVYIDFFRYGELVIREPSGSDKNKLDHIQSVFNKGSWND